MVKRLIFIISILISSVAVAQEVSLPAGKTIYIPKDLQQMDLQNPESKWSYHRMVCSDNFVVFWEKGSAMI